MPQYFDSTASFPMKTKKRVYATGGRVGLWHGGPHNTGRMNLLEEEGRIRSEPQTRNVRAEEGRVIGELNRGYNKGGRVGLKKGGNGKWIQKEIGMAKPWIIASFHPAFLMRQPEQKKLAWIDLKMNKITLGELK